MNVIFPRFLKSAYRKEPISSFIVIVGATDLVMGGVGTQWTLFSLGLILILTAGLIRWQKIQKVNNLINQEKTRARYILPPSSSRPSLPTLMSDKSYR
jgi:hypothetical protein